MVKEIWQKYFGGPRHLITIAQAFGEKKQVTINMYFKAAHEVDSLMQAARSALDNEEADFQRKIEAIQAKIKKQQEKNKEAK